MKLNTIETVNLLNYVYILKYYNLHIVFNYGQFNFAC